MHKMCRLCKEIRGDCVKRTELCPEQRRAMIYATKTVYRLPKWLFILASPVLQYIQIHQILNPVLNPGCGYLNSQVFPHNL